MREFKKTIITATLFTLVVGSACVRTNVSTPGQIGHVVSSLGGSSPSAGSADELNTESEKHAVGYVFRAGDSYYICLDGETTWRHILSDESGELSNRMGDFDFGTIDADVAWLSGGIAGYINAPLIRKVHSYAKTTFDVCDQRGLIADYDPDADPFISSPSVYRDGDDEYVAIYVSYNDYRVYKNGTLLGSYETALEVSSAMGINEIDTTADYESIHNASIYVFNLNGTYIAYSRYYDLSQWTPILDKNFGNSLVGTTLKDGEMLFIQDANIEVVSGGAKGYVKTPLIKSFTMSEHVSYDNIIINKHWEDGLAKTDYACAGYDSGRYMIIYLAGQYYVYYDDPAVDEDNHFIGVYDTVDDVNTAMGR